MIVVDASVLAPALGDDGPGGDHAGARLQQDGLGAPELIDLEVSSIFRQLVLRNQMRARRAELALSDLVALPLRRVSHRTLLPRCWSLRENLTPYEASYVALAEHLDAVSVTADARLSRAPGLRCRIEVLARSPEDAEASGG